MPPHPLQPCPLSHPAFPSITSRSYLYPSLLCLIPHNSRPLSLLTSKQTDSHPLILHYPALYVILPFLKYFHIVTLTAMVAPCLSSSQHKSPLTSKHIDLRRLTLDPRALYLTLPFPTVTSHARPPCHSVPLPLLFPAQVSPNIKTH